MRLPVLFFLVLFSTISAADEKINLEYLMLVVGNDTSSPSSKNLYLFKSTNKSGKTKTLNFENMIIVRDSKEHEIKNDIVLPLFRFKQDRLPHPETMFIENEEVYIKHIFDNTEGPIKTKIATLGRWASFDATQKDNEYKDFRIYELLFEKGIEVKQFAAGEISSSEEILLDLENMLQNQEHQRNLNRLRREVFFNNSKRATKKEISQLNIKYPGLRPSINEFIKLLEIQLKSNNQGKAEIKRFLSQAKVHLYTMAKKSDSLFYRNGDDISKDSAHMLNNKSQVLYSKEHVSERLNNLMSLFFNTVHELDLAKNSKDAERVDQLSIESLRLLSEVYIIAGLTKGSIGLEKIYSGMISMTAWMGFTISAVLANTWEIKIAMATTAVMFFAHSMKKLYEKQIMYKESRMSYPGVKKIVQYKNSKNLREHVLDLSFEIGLHDNRHLINLDSDWSKFAYQSDYMPNEFMHKVIRIIELASGEKIESSFSKFNEYYTCKQIF